MLNTVEHPKQAFPCYSSCTVMFVIKKVANNHLHRLEEALLNGDWTHRLRHSTNSYNRIGKQ